MPQSRPAVRRPRRPTGARILPAVGGIATLCLAPVIAEAQSQPVGQAQSQVQGQPQNPAPVRTEAAAGPVTDATRVADVVVSGQRAEATASIDRRVYRVDADLQSASGSASDVLRNIPSVEVDAQGVVSLRGDPSVQILIDGRPSTTMSALNRADTLAGLSANGIETIEIITNPSAAYRPDGAAGIINIVTRKTHAPGVSGSIRASAGTDGRYSLGATGTSHFGDLTLSGNLGLRQDRRVRNAADDRVSIDPVTGAETETRQNTHYETGRLSKTVGANLEYAMTSADALTAAASYTQRSGSLSADQTSRVTGSGGLVLSDYDRTGGGEETQTSAEISAGYRHTFAQDRVFSLDLRRGRTVEDQTRLLTNVYRTPAGPDRTTREHPSESEIQRQVTASYTSPLGGGDLDVGYDLLREDADYHNRSGVLSGAGVYTADPALTNRFRFARTIHAAYATWERPLGDRFTTILGLRLEDAIGQANQVSLGTYKRTETFDLYPTLHLQYALSDAQILRFSYSKRVSRPEVEDLNPFPVATDPLNLRAGNPDLRPRQTDSFEASWRYSADGTTWEVTPYVRLARDGFTEVSRFISPTVLLTTEENLGKSTAAGAAFSGRGKLGERLTWRFSGDAAWSRLDPGNLGFEVRSGSSISLKGGLDFQATPADMVQVSLDYRGRRLTAQGYREAMSGMNLGYLHTFANGVTAVATVSDVFDSQVERSIIDTAPLRQSTERRGAGRLFNLAITIPFGGARPAQVAPAELTD